MYATSQRAFGVLGGGGIQSVAHDVRFVEFVSVISFGSYSMFRIGSFFDSWHRLANTFKRELSSSGVYLCDDGRSAKLLNDAEAIHELHMYSFGLCVIVMLRSPAWTCESDEVTEMTNGKRG